MGKMLRGPICLLSIILLSACTAQRSGEKGERSQIRYDLSLRALETGRFTIEIDTFYETPARRNGVKPVTSSYVAVRDGKAEIHLLPGRSFRSRTWLDQLNRNNRARIAKLKTRKNGSAEFLLEIQDGLQAGPTFLGADMNITLFGKTDECFVSVNRAGGGQPECSFRGRVVPD